MLIIIMIMMIHICTYTYIYIYIYISRQPRVREGVASARAGRRPNPRALGPQRLYVVILYV